MSAQPNMQSHALADWIGRQRFIPYRLRRSLLKRLTPALLRNYSFEADFMEGLRFRGNIANYCDRIVFFCGAHEKYMLRMLADFTHKLKQKVPDPLMFLDVGAHTGNHALFMAKLGYRTLAVEPCERMRRQLEENIALNGLKDAIAVLPFGFGKEDVTRPFYMGPDSNLGSSSFSPSHRPENAQSEMLPIRHGDKVLQEMNLPSLHVVKVDVEGFEPEVLQGLSESLKRHRPLVIMEVSGTTRESLGDAEAFHALFPERYRYFYFKSGNRDSGRYRLAPFAYALTPAIEDVIACPEEWLESVSP